MKRKHPFFVIDGIDYSGKSRLLESVYLSIDDIRIEDGIPTWKEDKTREKETGIKLYHNNQERFEYFKKLNEEFGDEIIKTTQNQAFLLARYALSTIGGHNVLLGERTEDQFTNIVTPDITFLVVVEEGELKRRMEVRPPAHKYESNAKTLLDMQNEMIRVAMNQKYQELYGRTEILESKRGFGNNGTEKMLQEINNSILAYK